MAWVASSFSTGVVGRTWKPVVWASAIAFVARVSESSWQTTFVPGASLSRRVGFFLPLTFLALAGAARTAEASERASGILPPAAGVTDVSGFGVGQ